MSMTQAIFQRRLTLASPQNLFLHGLFFLFSAFLFSRGALELVLPKAVAMLLQCFGVFGLASLWYLLDKEFCFTSTHRLYVLVLIPFCLLVCISGWLTEYYGFPFWFVYVGFSLALVWMTFVSAGLSTGAMPALQMAPIFLFWGWMLTMVGFTEQLRFLSMPGSCLSFIPIRAASLTGSFLHYPILMALITGICAQWYSLTGRRIYGISVAIFSLTPLLTFSRSGVFIVGLALILGLAWRMLRGDGRAILFAICLGGLALGLGAWAAQSGNSPLAKMVLRVFTATDKRAAGNEGRIRSWTYGVELWADSNLLVGQHTGEITNSTKAFFKDPRVTVVESGVIQQLVNFGFLGALAFYSLLFFIFFRIQTQHLVLRCIFLAGVAESLFYQSIEVVPYISLLVLFPTISAAFDRNSRGG